MLDIRAIEISFDVTISSNIYVVKLNISAKAD
jgi:hypothetical protein